MAPAGFYRLEAKIVKRSAGQSAVAKAAYIARARYEDMRYGVVRDYTRHGNAPLLWAFYVPPQAQAWARDAAQLWNALEAHEKRKDAALAREFVVAIPHQMQLEHVRYALHDFVRENFLRKGLVAEIAVHPAHDHGDARNVHAHILVPLRALDAQGAWGEKRQQFVQDLETGKWRRVDKDELRDLRARWAHHLNRQLERFGYDIRVDHRSYQARGIDREPGVHLGKQDAAQERRGKRTRRGDMNRAILADNAARQRVRATIGELERMQQRDTQHDRLPPVRQRLTHQREAEWRDRER